MRSWVCFRARRGDCPPGPPPPSQTPPLSFRPALLCPGPSLQGSFRSAGHWLTRGLFSGPSSDRRRAQGSPLSRSHKGVYLLILKVNRKFLTLFRVYSHHLPWAPLSGSRLWLSQCPQLSLPSLCWTPVLGVLRRRPTAAPPGQRPLAHVAPATAQGFPGSVLPTLSPRLSAPSDLPAPLQPPTQPQGAPAPLWECVSA